MVTLKLDYVKSVMDGCANNDYRMICRAGRILSGIISGRYDINVEEPMKRKSLKRNLYCKFMRAYTRYIISNSNMVEEIAEDCFFASDFHVEYMGIIEPQDE